MLGFVGSTGSTIISFILPGENQLVLQNESDRLTPP